MTIPLCQQCGKKLYASYGRRGYLAESDKRWCGYHFKTQEECDAHEIPENAFEVDRQNPNRWHTNWRLYYHTPQQSRDGLFHNRSCWEQWHLDHRDDLERVIRSRGEWKS